MQKINGIKLLGDINSFNIALKFRESVPSINKVEIFISPPSEKYIQNATKTTITYLVDFLR
jgi:hypothetical protein